MAKIKIQQYYGFGYLSTSSQTHVKEAFKDLWISSIWQEQINSVDGVINLQLGVSYVARHTNRFIRHSGGYTVYDRVGGYGRSIEGAVRDCYARVLQKIKSKQPPVPNEETNLTISFEELLYGISEEEISSKKESIGRQTLP